ncbi:MAG TPA: ParB/RepB/Spo0J family partition protein [Nitrososphaeraceae archaeon]|nr:ParB/RepB/Spo0J family partition protein [Nitrososphaeraceae archaeon]
MTTDTPLVEERLPLPIISPAQVQTRIYASSSQQESIYELSRSIKKHGLLQPIIVRPISRGFEIVAGHRRFQACRLLRWKTIPAIVKDVSDKDAFEIQLVENIQRKTLDPIEEAHAFKLYVRDYGWGGVTYLAETIMKSEQYVSSRIQLLKLPLNVIDKVKSGELKVSHAFELLGIEGRSLENMSDDIINKNMSVKDIRRHKHQLSFAKDRETVENTAAVETKAKMEIETETETVNTMYDKDDYSNDGFLFPMNSEKDHIHERLHHKLMFLKKVQLSLKASLSRADSLIHEYEESDATEIKVTSSQSKVRVETEMYGDSDDISKMLMRFRLGIHSMLDETIRSTSKLAKEESISK